MTVAFCVTLPRVAEATMVAVFGEVMNPFKIGGICAIMAGVGVLGLGSHK